MPTNRIWILLPLALVLVGVVYTPHIGPDFVGLDFSSYENVLYTNDFVSISWRLLGDVTGRLVPGYFAPLGSITLALDKVLIASELPDARVTVAINVLFHGFNGIVLFVLLSRLGLSPLVASVAACIFLLHPIQVASVMWFAERKTVMAACFSFLSYSAYLKHRQFDGTTAYVAALLAYVAGLLCKPTVVVLPVIFLIGELLGMHSAKSSSIDVADRAQSFGGRIDPTQLAKLVPFFALALGMGLVTVGTEITDKIDLPLSHRPFVAASAFWFYLCKILVPMNLLAVYPQWKVNTWSYLWWIPLLLSVLAVYVLIRYRGRISKHFWLGLAFLVIPFLPVIGIIRFGYFQFSYVGDHLAYLSMAGGALCLALIVEALWQRAARRGQNFLRASLFAYFALLTFLTWQQTGVWSDPIGLWRHNVDRCPSCLGARLALANTLYAFGLQEQAGPEYEEILRKVPDHVKALNGLALARLSQDRPEDAIQLLKTAMSHHPEEKLLQHNQAAALQELGRAREAVEVLQRMIQQDPLYAPAYLTLGQAMLHRKAYADAEKLFRKAIAVNPDFADAHAALAQASLEQRRLEEARELALRAIQIRANTVMAYNALGQIALVRERSEEALEFFGRALRFRPDAWDVHSNLGAAFMALGRFAEAKESFEAAIRLRPQFAEAHANLGFALINLGNTNAAIEHLQKALDINPSLSAARDALERAREISAAPNSSFPQGLP
ncbi:MAG: tetratricopeptide repeat protein [Deltaproteobacteria bacterium]|nr:tetratricopeptide repeat protein [Deltaproteobacteria bacterium]